MEERSVDFLSYTNAQVEDVKALSDHQGFHVVRDPRDVLVSAYFSHKNSHPTEDWPELKDHRRALQSLEKEEGLLKEIEFSRPFLETMRGWDYEQEHILEVKMEELTSAPDTYFPLILRHLGLWRDEDESVNLFRRGCHYGNRVLYKLHHALPVPIPKRLTVVDMISPSTLEKILSAHRFERMTGGRSKGEADPDSHYRKGEPGDWKNHFTDRVHRVFRERYGGLVVKLGYDGEVVL